MMKVDVIIPTYKPDQRLLGLLERLNQQTLRPNRILIINTEERYLWNLIPEHKLLARHKNLQIVHIEKKNFDHGGTRHSGVLLSDAEIFVMMTQDALPADRYLLEKLTEPLKKEDIAVAYARQLPRKGCKPIERYLRAFNYPDCSMVKSSLDLKWMGIKTYFCSNVCCAYRRDVYQLSGGFVRRTIFNEDMLYAARVMGLGYRVAYTAQARVLHSHNYTCMQQLRRNFDLGVSQAMHPEVFAKIPSEKEGIRSVRGAAEYLMARGLVNWIPYLIVYSAFKYAGYLLGKHYERLPKGLILRLTDNAGFWENHF